MIENITDIEQVTVRLATSKDEIEAAQRLRYDVFYIENGATPSEETKKEKRDFDDFDEVADHLIVLDNSIKNPADQIVGTYRLMRYESAQKYGRFYTSDEYDIAPLMSFEQGLLELGRSCVLPPYRTRPVLQKLWQGIAHYVADNKIDLMFGCASLQGTDIDQLSKQLSYLYHYHLAKEGMCPRAVDERYVDMNIIAKDDLEPRRVFSEFPPLIKGYLRLGASIGDGAVIDHQFNTTDVCIVLPTAQVTEKYVRHYERVTKKDIPGSDRSREKDSLSA